MSDDEQLIQTRLDVAEMKGMLTQALSDHGQRISNLEADARQKDIRLGEKAKRLAGHEERIKDLEDDNSARMGRVLGVLGSIIAAAALVVSLWNEFGGGR